MDRSQKNPAAVLCRELGVSLQCTDEQWQKMSKGTRVLLIQDIKDSATILKDMALLGKDLRDIKDSETILKDTSEDLLEDLCRIFDIPYDGRTWGSMSDSDKRLAVRHIITSADQKWFVDLTSDAKEEDNG